MVLWIMLGVLIIAGLAGGAYYLGRQASPRPSPPPVTSPASRGEQTPQPTPSSNASREPTASTETASWKIYTTSKLTFKYPPGFRVEEREKDFFVIVPSGKDVLAPQEGISIDARLLQDKADFNRIVERAKDDLTDIRVESMGDWIKISGKVGPGFGEGLPVTIALIKYQQGAISVEYLQTDPSITPIIFDRVLTSFRFL